MSINAHGWIAQRTGDDHITVTTAEINGKRQQYRFSESTGVARSVSTNRRLSPHGHTYILVQRAVDDLLRRESS